MQQFILIAAASLLMGQGADAFSVVPRSTSSTTTTRLHILPPQGSGYATDEDAQSHFPDSYDPMLEYPGTMRPGRTPENMPFHDLPLDVDGKELIPWPHFQQIEWHHRWNPPHPHPIPMEEFIEQQGRWATPELEAKMRAGSRRSVRQRQEMEEQKNRDTLIMDDEDDEDDDFAVDETEDLGEGMFGTRGSAADQAITAEVTAPDRKEEATAEELDEEVDVDTGLDDFLLDLGLDMDDDDDEDSSSEEDPTPVAEQKPGTKELLEDIIVSEDDGDDEEVEDIPDNNSGVTASLTVDDDDDDLDLGLDDDDEDIITTDDGVSTVPLDNFGDDDDMGEENFFDDGGFDYDNDGGDFDGGDMW